MACCSQEHGTELKAISVRHRMGWMDWAGWWVYGLETELAVENNRGAQALFRNDK